jgi:hypothetical protein
METTTIEQIYNHFLDLAHEDDLAELIELYDEYKNNNEFMELFIKNYNDEFYNFCLSGNVDIVKWYYGLKPTTIQMKNNDINTTFIDTCGEGLLQVAEWLLKIKPSIIEDTNTINKAIKNCAKSHEYTVLCWLSNLKTDFNKSAIKKVKVNFNKELTELVKKKQKIIEQLNDVDDEIKKLQNLIEKLNE